MKNHSPTFPRPALGRRLPAAAPWGLFAARAAVGIIFLVAGLDKVQAPGAFADAVRSYQMLPGALVLPFALVVPWLELLVAGYLLIGFMTRFAAIGAILMLGMFVVALVISLISGNTNRSCGCFGSGATANPILVFLSGGDTITWWDPIRDILLAGFATFLFLYGSGALALDQASRALPSFTRYFIKRKA